MELALKLVWVAFSLFTFLSESAVHLVVNKYIVGVPGVFYISTFTSTITLNILKTHAVIEVQLESDFMNSKI